jgi:hypothetical protein
VQSQAITIGMVNSVWAGNKSKSHNYR